MAYERTQEKIKGDSLDAFVSNLSSQFNVQMKIRNAEEELKFNEAIINDGLSVEEQLEYRKEQLKKVKDDPTERARIRGEIAGLKARVEQKQFSDTYLEKLISYESGLSSIDTVISYLEDQKATATDQSIIDEINKQLVTKKSEKFALTTKLITDQTEYAMKDKSVQVIEDQLAKVTVEKNKALLAGNDTLVANFNLQIQALNKAKTENSIERDIKNFAASNITGYASATSLLDAYNSKIESAPANTPITIGDVTYSSAKEFWTYKRDSYVADNSTSGLFGRLSTEVSQKIKTASSKNMLDSKVLDSYTKDISKLTGRPELAGYESKIDAVKQDLVQSGADLITDVITNRYAVDYDLNKAVGALNNLKAIGVNIDSAYAKIIVAGANVKTGQINSILNAAQNALQNDPNLTPEAAISQAIASGASIVKSPEDLANTPEDKLAKDITKTSTENAGVADPKLTVQPSQTTPTQTPTDGSSFSTMNGNFKIGSTGPEVKKIQTALGITADGIFGKQTDAAVKAYQAQNGLVADGIVGAKTSAVLLKTSAPTSTPTPTPTPASAPKVTNKTPTPTPTPAPAPAPVVQKTQVNPTPPAPTIPVTYTIKSGDNLTKIAKQYGTSVAALTALNSIKDPNKIRAGATIKIK